MSMHSYARLTRYVIEKVSMKYTFEGEGYHITMKEPESGWLTVVPIINGYVQRSFSAPTIERGINAIKRKYNIELSEQDYKAERETTDFSREEQ